ncbi:hypothetical protein CDL12_30180 [Handroanthus impetiginosus]|uniref:Transmembrane protein n=1 Tax=Handroanthus impetiginosus TaxID=429701 RepID=A0A2G9FWB4_9LAMI|nr:hypothetical protein CDL12_30180 [Handroanthus impetiginosus]
MLHRKIQHLSCALLLLAFLPLSTLARPHFLVVSQDDLSESAAAPNHPSPQEDAADFDDFPESESKPDSVLDPGSWSPLFEPDPNFKSPNPSDDAEVIYYNGVRKMVEASSRGEFRVMEEASAEIEAAAELGQPHGQSVDMIDSLPEVHPKVEAWVENVIMEEGNATILTLFVCLLTVLYLRERQRRHAAAAAAAAGADIAPPQQAVEHAAPLVN